MTNVLFVSHSSELNGAERMLLDTVRRLDRGKFSPILAVPRPGPLAEAAAGARIDCLTLPMKWTLTEPARVWKQPLSLLWNIRSVRVTARMIGDLGIGLVVTNTAAVWTGALGARRAGVPHVWLIHEILDGERPLLKYVLGRKALVRRMTRLSKRIIANSAASARAFAGSGKVVIIGNGISMRTAPAADISALRSSLGIEPEAPVVGVVGKIYPGKGQKEAVLAADILRRARPTLRLLLVGEAADSRYDESVRETVGRLGLEKNVIFARPPERHRGGPRPARRAPRRVLGGFARARRARSHGRGDARRRRGGRGHSGGGQGRRDRGSSRRRRNPSFSRPASPVCSTIRRSPAGSP